LLADDIIADGDLPPFDRSQMDGYAAKAKDTDNAPVVLKIVGESAAGHGWHKTLRKGEAVRIMTGAPVPAGADAVQKVELTKEVDGEVTIHEAVALGKNIVRRGAEIKKGARLFRKGEIFTDRMIASLASFGYAQVRVHKRPAVSILSTGSEIVPIDKKPGRDQIRNSNSVMIKALCEKAGAVTKILPQTGDDLEKLKRTISKAVTGSNILVITGGVSVGKYDLTKPALRELGAEIFFERVRLKPGKPTVFARLGDTLIFGLPGNPVSAAVTFYLFVRYAIMQMQSASQADLPSGNAVVPVTTKGAKERDTYLPASLSTDAPGRLLATPLRWQGSSDFIGFAKADALIFVPAGEVIRESTAAQIVFLNS
jgi:molybdenum cofactor synthesis domain-containing protein